MEPSAQVDTGTADFSFLVLTLTGFQIVLHSQENTQEIRSLVFSQPVQSFINPKSNIFVPSMGFAYEKSMLDVARL